MNGGTAYGGYTPAQPQAAVAYGGGYQQPAAQGYGAAQPGMYYAPPPPPAGAAPLPPPPPPGH